MTTVADYLRLRVLPASRRLDLHLVRRALGDSHARLATEDELRKDFSGYDLGALPAVGSLLGLDGYVDPAILRHDTVLFAAGTQTESIQMWVEDLRRLEDFTITPLCEALDRDREKAYVR